MISNQPLHSSRTASLIQGIFAKAYLLGKPIDAYSTRQIVGRKCTSRARLIVGTLESEGRDAEPAGVEDCNNVRDCVQDNNSRLWVAEKSPVTAFTS